MNHCDKCKTISIKKDRPLTAGGGYPVVGCSNPSCKCHPVVKEDQSNEWRERFGQRFPNQMQEVIDDFGSTLKNDIEAFIASEKQKSYEEGYKAAITNNKQ